MGGGGPDYNGCYNRDICESTVVNRHSSIMEFVTSKCVMCHVLQLNNDNKSSFFYTIAIDRSGWMTTGGRHAPGSIRWDSAKATWNYLRCCYPREH